MTRNAPIAVLFACLAGLSAADAPAPAVAPAPAAKGAPGAPPAAKPKEGDALDQLAEEERWTFDPQINRKDIFYDLEAILALPNPELVNTETNPKQTGPNVQGSPDGAARLRPPGAQPHRGGGAGPQMG